VNPGPAARAWLERELGRIVDRAFPDPEVRATLAGRHLAIHLLNPKLDCYLSLGHLGVSFEAPPSSPPDLSLTGSIADFRALARGESPPGLRMAGDLGWIRTVGTLAKSLPRERPARIALLLGDALAGLINPGIDRAGVFTHEITVLLGPWAARVLATAGCGVDRHEDLRLKEAIETLASLIKDLETRLSVMNDTESA